MGHSNCQSDPCVGALSCEMCWGTRRRSLCASPRRSWRQPVAGAFRVARGPCPGGTDMNSRSRHWRARTPEQHRPHAAARSHAILEGCGKRRQPPKRRSPFPCRSTTPRMLGTVKISGSSNNQRDIEVTFRTANLYLGIHRGPRTRGRGDCRRLVPVFWVHRTGTAAYIMCRRRSRLGWMGSAAPQGPPGRRRASRRPGDAGMTRQRWAQNTFVSVEPGCARSAPRPASPRTAGGPTSRSLGPWADTTDPEVRDRPEASCL